MPEQAPEGTAPGGTTHQRPSKARQRGQQRVQGQRRSRASQSPPGRIIRPAAQKRVDVGAPWRVAEGGQAWHSPQRLEVWALLRSCIPISLRSALVDARRSPQLLTTQARTLQRRSWGYGSGREQPHSSHKYVTARA